MRGSHKWSRNDITERYCDIHVTIVTAAVRFLELVRELVSQHQSGVVDWKGERHVTGLFMF